MSFQISNSQDTHSKIFILSEKTEWLRDFRKRAYEKLLNSEFPNSKMEVWRKFPFENFHPSDFAFFHDLVNIESKEEGVILNTFSNTTGEKSNTLKKILEEILLQSSGDFFKMFNLAFFSSAYYLEIEGKEISQPIMLRYSLSKDSNSIFPLTVVNANTYSNTKIVEDISTKHEKSQIFINSFTYILQKDSSNVTYIATENFHSTAIHFRNIYAKIGKDSNFTNFYFNKGGFKGKTVIESDINGSGSFVETLGANALTGNEFLDTDIRINHNANNTSSNLLVKIVTKDKSHHVFTGNLNIPKSSAKAIATQMNKNLILHRTSRAESIPKLEVFAHDVKCSHGATVGEIQEEELFYLLSRGLKEDEARSLIVEGFLSEVLDRLPIESEKESMKNYIHEKLFGNDKEK
ncbi:MAG: Fe-S cluster assembly protein SufD [Leptospiraceae bacterium]|nr:Fe-S cluster assembly protein SufD [Leptospiraceae bacterium]MCK6381240.1 Fe-S cluster assembly protein SufD [Leptospiraceae bacterium]NUM41872.1 Fe-S cluster assembly protein SufD [Leptospiraceae bacterium]